MLNPKFVIKGPPSDYFVPSGWSMGKYIIDCQKSRDPNDVICVDGITNETLTSGKFVEEVLKLAYLLRGFGIEKDDVVAIATENELRFAVVVVAIIYIGAVANPLNPGYSIGELRHAFSMSRPKIVFCSETAVKTVVKANCEVDSVNRIILMGKVSDVDYYNSHETQTLETLLSSVTHLDDVVPAHFDASEQTAMLMLSSGTTGLPKGVLLTHENFRNLVGYARHQDWIGLRPEDVGVAVLPFFHLLGLASIVFSAVHSSKAIILPSFQPEVFLKCVQDHKATVANVVPPIVSFLAKHPAVKKYDIGSLRMLLCSGGSLGKEIQEEFSNLYPSIMVRLMYGITETTGACTIMTDEIQDKPGSVGRVIPDTEGMIWSADLESNLEPGRRGELCFKGPTIMKGYMGRHTKDIDENGYYHTGDVGYYDEDGCFYIEGRIKELIKYKGFQVPPAELEDLLLKHPLVKECGVVGIPDERTGQLPTALVVLQNGANVITPEEIVSFVAERISVQKRLHGGVKFVEAIPRNAAGKILRTKLLDLYNAL